MKIFIFFFIPFCLFANQKAFYHFEELDTQIPRDKFRRYVRPQMRSMVNEFFLLLKKVEPQTERIVKIKNLMDKSRSSLNNQIKLCNDFTEECDKQLKDLISLHYSIDKEISQTLSDNFLENKKNIPRQDQILIFRNKISTLLKTNLSIISQLEQISLVTNTPYIAYAKTLNEVSTTIYEFNIQFDQTIPILLSSELNDEFSAIYINFIKKADNHIVDQLDDQYLIKNLEKFNNQWNSFHMRMAKSTIKLDKNALNIIQIMHNRWNSILKVILKRW